MSKDVKSVCYYCGEPATSVEHVPPKCFFLKVNERSFLLFRHAILITIVSRTMMNM